MCVCVCLSIMCAICVHATQSALDTEKKTGIVGLSMIKCQVGNWYYAVSNTQKRWIFYYYAMYKWCIPIWNKHTATIDPLFCLSTVLSFCVICGTVSPTDKLTWVWHNLVVTKTRAVAFIVARVFVSFLVVRFIDILSQSPKLKNDVSLKINPKQL